MGLEDEIKKADFRSIVYTAIITALAFVVGLFWRDAITATIDQIIPKGESLFYKYAAALAVTVIVIIAVYIMLHAQKVANEKLAKLHVEIMEKRAKRKGLQSLR
jgi:short subunit fatty acids transporter